MPEWSACRHGDPGDAGSSSFPSILTIFIHRRLEENYRHTALNYISTSETSVKRSTRGGREQHGPTSHKTRQPLTIKFSCVTNGQRIVSETTKKSLKKQQAVYIKNTKAILILITKKIYDMDNKLISLLTNYVRPLLVFG